MSERFPGVYASTGVFVCFEGGEGAGKSTQSKMLGERLEAAGHVVLLTHEPGATPVGAEVRRIVLDPSTGELADRTEALLYAADKAEHIHAVVRPALERGEVVVTDRYVDSTLAYQGAGRSLDAAELEWVARWATEDLRPHLTVLLDLDPAAGLTRFAGRDRIEGESIEFHQRVRGGVPEAGEGRSRPLPGAGRPGTGRGDRRVRARPGLRPPGRRTSMTAASDTRSAGTVWDGLVGQRAVIERLQRAVAGDMSHAWLFTGPPGSGRSNAAIAFAAGLQCEQGGCGVCHSCHEIAVGSHPDVRVTRTEKLSIGVDEVRDLVRSSALAPVGNRWQVMVVEDADRLTDQAANALLKAIEEPTERTVWLLCAPTVEDVLPTIRSRTRLVVLATPSVEDVTDFLVRTEGLGVETASYAARASQGHIGRARALARDEDTRRRRREVVAIPARLTSLGACMSAAADLHDLAKEEAEALTTEHDEREKVDLDRAYGVVERGRRPREYAPALRDMEKSQKTRAKRRHLDVVDRGLMDLISVYRDVLTLQLGAHSELVNEELRGDVVALANSTSAEQSLARIEAVFEAREQMLEFNVPPLLALESMMVALRVSTELDPDELGVRLVLPHVRTPGATAATVTAAHVHDDDRGRGGAGHGGRHHRPRPGRLGSLVVPG